MTIPEAQKSSEPDTEADQDSVPPVRLARIAKKLAPFAVSLGLHVIIVCGLAAWVLPLLTRGTDLTVIESAIEKNVAQSQPLADTTKFDISGPSSPSSLQTVATQVPTSVPVESQMPTTPRKARDAVVRRSSLNSLTELSDDDLTQELNLGVQANPMYSHRGETRVKEVENAMDIADTLQGDLLSIAKDGDTMVVWLLDQSLSMQKDLKVLAHGLVDTLQQIEADKTSKMQHAVVAFGDNVTLVQKPTFRGFRVANAIHQLPADPSGLERTFESVEWCLQNLLSSISATGRRRERQKLIVLWTDESGDDYLRLENTIALCRRANVRVDIIGPSAVLGAQTGYSAYLHPEDGRTYYLPVHRGPDSAFPQKLSLGYWYRGVPGSFDESFRGPHQGTSPRWYGGSNLQGLLSGFSPYALTRLSRETGGRYLMYDRPGDRAPYSEELLREYRPDYSSARDILFQLQRQPLRQVILASASRTWSDSLLARTEPQMSFRPRFPGQPKSDYVTSVLVPNLRREMSLTWERAKRVELALQPYFAAEAMPGFKPRHDVSGHRRLPAESEEAESAENDDMESSEQASPEALADLTSPDSAKETDDPNDGESDTDEDRDKAADKDEDIESTLDLGELETELNQSLLDQLYQAESSPRWRAWCDLNVGRLLLISVRMREYLMVSQTLLTNLNRLGDNTNHVYFSKATAVRGGAVRGGAPSKERLAIARRLLERCIEQNAGTPWQVMAERELRDDVSLTIHEQFIPQPKITPVVPTGPRPPRPKLPNL